MRLLASACLVWVTCAAASPVLAQTPAAGTLLVATASLTDRSFAESVVLVIHHDADGTLGVLINRPTNLMPARVFPDEPALARYADALFLGGPLNPSQLILLLRGPVPDDIGGPPLLGDIYLSADPDVLESLSAPQIGADRLRLYAGHAAWAPGQLEGEIAAGDWRVLPGRSELVFARDPLSLWKEMARPDAELVAAVRASR